MSIPVEKKFALTITEAAEYFNIGENKLREMIKEPGHDYVMYIGKKALIKRDKMEKYLSEVTYL